MVCNLQMRAAVCEVANCFPTAIVSGRSKDKVIHSLNKILHYVDIRYHPSFFEVVLFSFCFQTCIFNAYLYFSFFFFFVLGQRLWVSLNPLDQKLLLAVCNCRRPKKILHTLEIKHIFFRWINHSFWHVGIWICEVRECLLCWKSWYGHINTIRLFKIWRAGASDKGCWWKGLYKFGFLLYNI